MESIYFVMSWVCHRTCAHCYEDRFHPYHGEELERVVAQAEVAIPRIIGNLPASMTYLESDGIGKRGRIIVAGGEILLDAVRERILYPALTQLRNKYRGTGGVELIVQTTGDILNVRHVSELLQLGVDVISVSGLDAWHTGLEESAARDQLRLKLTSMFAAAGMEPWVPPPDRLEGTRYYHFFGATPDSWIGRLWPRGRSWTNELSTATIEDNFCNGWSGGLNFLEYGKKGSEVSIDPEGNVYPCCLKTKLPLGNLLDDRLEDVLARLRGSSVYEAISAGSPQHMGLAHGWSEDTFIEKSKVVLPSGRTYQNLCIGCDKFHEEVLSPKLFPISGLSAA